MRGISRFSAIALSVSLALHAIPPGIAKSGDAGELEPIDSEEALRSHLTTFFVAYLNGIEFAAFQAMKKAPESREKIIVGKIMSTRACRAAVFQDNVLVSFLDTWSFVIRSRAFLNSPKGKETLGVLTEDFIALFDNLLAELESISKSFIPKEKLEELRVQIEQWSQQHPIQNFEGLLQEKKSASIPGVGWVLSIPMAPIKAMKGVDTTAQAASRLGGTLDLLSQFLSSLPVEIAWEAELLEFRTHQSMERLINLAALRAAQLILIVFALRFCFRLLANRRAKVDSK